MARPVVALLLLGLAVGAMADAVAEGYSGHSDHFEVVSKSFKVYSSNPDLFNKAGKDTFSLEPFSKDAPETASVTYGLACQDGGAPIGVCHQAGIHVSQTVIEPNQNLATMLFCEIKANSCGLGVGQLHGMGLAPQGYWGFPGGLNIYPVSFSIVGGTGAYSNVLGGTVTFTQSAGTTFNLRVTK